MKIHHFIASTGLSLIISAVSATFTLAETPRTIHHAQGQLQVTKIPSRVAVLDLASLDTLDALGVDVVGVPSGSKNWPDYLQKYADSKYVQVGNLFEPDTEALKELKPDLIIVAGRSRSKLPELSEIAPTIDLTTSTTSFLPSVVQNVLTLGILFGKEHEASVKVTELLTKSRDLQSKASKQGVGALMFAVGENASVHLPNTRFGIVYELVGIHPLLPAEAPQAESGEGRRGEQRRGEGEASEAARAQRAEAAKQALAKAFERDPNWIFVIDRNAAFKERENAQEILAANDTIANSTAWKEGRVVHLSGSGWYLIGGGYTQLLQTIDQIDQAFTGKDGR